MRDISQLVIKIDDFFSGDRYCMHFTGFCGYRIMFLTEFHCTQVVDLQPFLVRIEGFSFSLFL